MPFFHSVIKGIFGGRELIALVHMSALNLSFGLLLIEDQIQKHMCEVNLKASYEIKQVWSGRLNLLAGLS